MRWEKEEGGYLGAMSINYSVATGGWLLMLVVVLALTVPDVPIVLLLLLSTMILVALPLWFYPRAKMLWAAIEFMIARSQPDYQEPLQRDPRSRELE